MDLSERTILVTGVSRGIGLATARHLTRRGARVVGLSRTAPCDPSAVTTHIALDLAATAQLPAELRRIADAHPGIDGIVCNAGAGRFGALEQFSAGHIRELTNLNLLSPMLLAREFVPRLKRRTHADLVFIGSESALRGSRRGAVYCATKFGLRGFTQALRQECGPAGVRVGLVNPGMVATTFFAGQGFRPGRAPGQHLVADDVAAAVVFMLTARAGTVIDEIDLSPATRVIEFGTQ